VELISHRYGTTRIHPRWTKNTWLYHKGGEASNSKTFRKKGCSWGKNPEIVDLDTLPMREASEELSDHEQKGPLKAKDVPGIYQHVHR